MKSTKQYLSQYDRMYAALHVLIVSSQDGEMIDVKTVSERIGVSKQYAARLLRPFLDHGLIVRKSVTYRGNTDKYVYGMGKNELKRASSMGYMGQAKESAMIVAKFNTVQYARQLGLSIVIE